MNEQIKKLMFKAGYAAPELAGRAQVLAELIVRECIKVIDDKPIFGSHPIKEHFGVEE